MARMWTLSGCNIFLLLLPFFLDTGLAQNTKTTPQGTDCTQILTKTPGASSGLYLIPPVGVKQPFQNTKKPQGKDCTQILTKTPGAGSGLYLIQPVGVKQPFQVYCEMMEDGGWTVFQRRTGNTVSFRRNWAQYKRGFGDPRYDHWLGLEKLRALTSGKRNHCTMRVDLWDFEGSSAFAKYRNFQLGSEGEAYRLSVGSYSGTAGDAIRGAYPGIDQNGFGFSTSDRDNDGCSPCLFGDILEKDCSHSEGGGGWWYSRCGSASLHGDWHPAGNNRGWASGLHWRTWRGPAPYSAKATRMSIKSN